MNDLPVPAPNPAQSRVTAHHLTGLGLALGLVLALPARAAEPPPNPSPQPSPPLNSAQPTAFNVTPQAEPSGAPSRGPAWAEYKHPTGLRLLHPPDWKIQPIPSALLLVPPNLATSAEGPDEAYLIGAESAAGVTAPDDPRVLAYLDLQMSQLAPFMRRSGSPEKTSCATAPGILVRWEGRNPRGDLIKAEGFTTLLKGYGIVLFAIGKEAALTGRERVLRGIFASLAAGEGQKDPLIVGKWRFWSYSSSAVGSLGTERSKLMLLKADGTCAWSSRTETSGNFKGGDSLGNETWVGGLAGVGQDADTGTWSAGDGKLFIQWKDGSVGSWDYKLGGVPGNRRLFLTGKGPKPDEWVEAP